VVLQEQSVLHEKRKFKQSNELNGPKKKVQTKQQLTVKIPATFSGK
jgi:hypothetical protein